MVKYLANYYLTSYLLIITTLYLIIILIMS